MPRVIWQTWKDATPGPKRYEGMASLVQLNPEYNYALFTDEDCARFMCELADPDVRRAYEVLSIVPWLTLIVQWNIRESGPAPWLTAVVSGIRNIHSECLPPRH